MKAMSSYENAQEATSDLPYGAFSNESSAGSNDGTDIVAEHLQDLYYALYQVLQLSNQTPNGSLENGNQSKQFLSALSNVAPFLYNSTTTYNKDAITLYVYNNEINVYRSLKNNNTAAFSDTTAWKLLYKVNSTGAFANMSLVSTYSLVAKSGSTLFFLVRTLGALWFRCRKVRMTSSSSKWTKPESIVVSLAM